jgi:hypothetical protein
MRSNVGAGLLAKAIYPTPTSPSLHLAHVHNFSLSSPSMNFFNRSRVAVGAFISYHFRK